MWISWVQGIGLSWKKCCETCFATEPRYFSGFRGGLTTDFGTVSIPGFGVYSTKRVSNVFYQTILDLSVSGLEFYKLTNGVMRA